MLYLQLLQNPVPASRPRVTRWGVYYGKRYTQYRKDAHATIGQAIGEAKAEGILPINSTIMIASLYEVERPKTTKLEYPSPDLDNYTKALWDALQSHNVITDDKQIISSIETKRWTIKQPQTHVLIKTLTSQDTKRVLQNPVIPQMLLQDMMTGMATALAADIMNLQKEK